MLNKRLFPRIKIWISKFLVISKYFLNNGLNKRAYLIAMGHTRQSSSKAPLWKRTVYSLLTHVPSGNINNGQFIRLFTCCRSLLLTIARSRDSFRSKRSESVNGLRTALEIHPNIPPWACATTAWILPWPETTGKSVTLVWLATNMCGSLGLGFFPRYSTLVPKLIRIPRL